MNGVLLFFLCTIQRREISLILVRASPLAAKFCTKTKTKRTTTFKDRVCHHWIKKNKNSKFVSINNRLHEKLYGDVDV